MIKTHEIPHGELGSSGVNQVLRNVVGGGRVSDFLESYEDVWIIVSSVTRAVRPSDSGGESLIGAVTVWGGSSSSSSDTVQGSVLLPHYRTILEWEVESTTVTHSSADWWDLLLNYPFTSPGIDTR